MEQIRDRGKSERQAQQVQSVIAGIIGSQTQVEFTTTDFETFRAPEPDIAGRDIPGTPQPQNRWCDMGTYWEE